MLLALQLNNLLGDGPTLVPVPDVVGQSQASATAELEGVLFVVAVNNAYSSTVAAGLVIEQSPQAGVEAIEGSTVTITVSLGEASGAGSSRRRRRQYVEVDGQQFPVNNAQEALHILNKARALAEKQSEEAAALAEKRVKRLIKRRHTAVPELIVPTPEISVSPELTLDASPVIEDINRLYKQAAQTAELRLHLAKKIADEDDEDDELILLL